MPKVVHLQKPNGQMNGSIGPGKTGVPTMPGAPASPPFQEAFTVNGVAEMWASFTGNPARRVSPELLSLAFGDQPVEGRLAATCYVDLVQEGFTANELEDNPGILARRYAQQHLVAHVPGIVMLAAPGSQADQYVLGEDGRPAEVYYASYGSNLFADRFGAYIEGGHPVGSTRAYAGARDKTPPAENIPVALNGTIHYAGDSTVWTGAVAFLDSAAEGKSLGRAYRISAEQFDDVVAQECQDEPGSKTVDLNKVIRDGKSVETGLYGTLIHAGDHNGRPVLTFTAPFSTAEARGAGHTISAGGDMVSNRSSEASLVVGTKKPWPVFSGKPSNAYRHMITSGLAETHGLSLDQADVYFAGSTGVVEPIAPVGTAAGLS